MKKFKPIRTSMFVLMLLSSSQTIMVSAQSIPVNQKNQPVASTPTSSNASGTCGTSKWDLNDGILTIHTGSLAHTPVMNADTNISPWASVSSQVIKIVFDGPVVASQDSLGLFAGLPNLTQIDGLSNLDTSNVTNMAFMFADTPNLTQIDGLSNLDTSNVTNMSNMFARSSKLKTLDLSHFNTSKVLKMASMFAETSSLTSLDLSNFDTSNVNNMNGMFSNTTSLVTLDLSHFNTSNVTDMGGMFVNASSLTNLDLSNFNTGKVTDMAGMFKDTSSLTSLNLSSFDTNKVASMEKMFEDASSLTSLDVSSFDTNNVTDMSYMFKGLSSLLSLDLSNFVVNNGVNTSGMFIAGDSNTNDFSGNLTLPPTLPIPDNVKTVNVKSGKQELKTRTSTLYVGDSWSAKDNFDGAKDKTGKDVDFKDITATGTVNTSKAGTYIVHYTYDGLNNKATVTVKANQKEIKVHDSTLYAGDAWSAKDNFDGAKDKTGKDVDFKDITVAGTVNTSKAGTYIVHYTYDGLDKTVTVTVKAKSNNTHLEVTYQAVYRLYNKNTGEHFYTQSVFERNSLIKDRWNNEGTGWTAPNSGTAVYRVYNPNAKGGDHYYTTSQYEANSLIKDGWKWDNNAKPVFYSGGKNPVYVAFNPNAKESGSHNYTSSAYEQQSLLKNGWKFGKVQFYEK